MRRATIFSAVVIALIMQLSVQAADWPRFLGPKANGFSPETGLSKSWSKAAPKQLWKTTLGDDGYAGPAVAGGKVFIVDHRGSQDIVRAINIKTGKNVWQYAYADDAKANYGFARATPCIDSNRVYTLGRQGLLNCLDVKSGKRIWSRNIQKDFSGVTPQWNYSASPIVDGKKLIVCPGGDGTAVVALDKTNGKTLWSGGGCDIPGYATPVIARIGGKRQYVVFGGTSLFGVDTEKGVLQWSIPWRTSYDINGATPIVIGNKIFCTSAYGHGCGLVEITRNRAKLVYENKSLSARFSTPVLYQGHIYGTEDPGNLVCLDPMTGKELWKQPGFEMGGLMAADGAIFAFDGKDGDLIAAKLTPTKYEELGRFMPLGGQSWTAPIISDGKLIVRNKASLACFDLK